MFHSLARVRKEFPLLNYEPFTEADFYEITARLNVVVFDVPLPIDGYFERRNGYSFIFINARLRGIHWTFAAAHELTHCLLETDTADDILLMRDGKHYHTKREQIADALALIMIVPFADLVKYSSDDYSDDLEMQRLLFARMRIFEMWQI